MSTGHGSWLEYIVFDDSNDFMWQCNIDPKPQEWEVPNLRDTYVLDSDSGKREDLRLIAEKRYDEADRIKSEMEERQRRDKQLRE